VRQRSKSLPDNELELSLLEQGFNSVIGIDEVGRGCWAGPVYVGAYIYNLDTSLISNVNDSKLVSPKLREELYSHLADSYSYCLEIGSIEDINQYGIGNTITRLIERMIEKFKNNQTYFLIDGYFKRNFGDNSRQIIKGDTKHYSIAAASILAKVARDHHLVELAKQFPRWGFDQHKGYGTAKHIAALNEHGVSPIHRINYKPVAEIAKLKNEYAP
jgi:ribonuclease HII